MIKHFVSPPERTNWRMDPQTLARALRARWSPHTEAKPTGAAVLDVDEGPFEAAENRSLEWRIGPAEGNTEGNTEGNADKLLEGALSREADTVILAGDLGDCARFAVWMKEELVPEGQPLVFYDDALVHSAEIEQGMDEETLLAAFAGRGAVSR